MLPPATSPRCPRLLLILRPSNHPSCPRDKVSLNALAVDATCHVIRVALESGANVKQVGYLAWGHKARTPIGAGTESKWCGGQGHVPPECKHIREAPSLGPSAGTCWNLHSQAGAGTGQARPAWDYRRNGALRQMPNGCSGKINPWYPQPYRRAQPSTGCRTSTGCPMCAAHFLPFYATPLPPLPSLHCCVWDAHAYDPVRRNSPPLSVCMLVKQTYHTSGHLPAPATLLPPTAVLGCLTFPVYPSPYLAGVRGHGGRRRPPP